MDVLQDSWEVNVSSDTQRLVRNWLDLDRVRTIMADTSSSSSKFNFYNLSVCRLHVLLVWVSVLPEII